MRSAVLVIDMQQDFFKEGRLKDHKDMLVKNVNNLIADARNIGVPIIWVRQEFAFDLSDAFMGIRNGKTPPVTVAGTGGSRLLPELQRESDDYEIIKKRYSAFFGTNLTSLLDDLGVGRLVICGVNTHACVRSSAIDAYQNDYEVILARDCIDSYDVHHHDVSVKYLSSVMATVRTNEEVLEQLQN